MSQENYFGAAVQADPEFALAQEGRLWVTTHRELTVADDGSLDLLIDVKSSFVGKIEITAGGASLFDFSAVTSHILGAGTSLDTFQRNTFFQAARSGDASTLFTHTNCYKAEEARFSGVINGGEKAFAGGDSREGSVILAPGQYALKLQNVSGGAIDIMVQFSFTEPAIPNIPS